MTSPKALVLRRSTGALLLAFTLVASAKAEEGVLVLHVSDTKGKPVVGVVLAPQGDGAAGPPTVKQKATDKTGRTRIRIASSTRPGHWVSLQILPRRDGPDWVFISPWNQRTLVPSFANEADNFVPVVLGERGNKDLLTSGQAIEAVTARILEQLGPRLDKGEITDEERRRVLTEQAAAFGLKPGEVDEAIRTWGAKAKDPYRAGLAALYEKNYLKAGENLTESLKLRRNELSEARVKVAETATFLGIALHGQNKYREAAEAFREALSAFGENEDLLDMLGLSLLDAGDLQGARAPLERSLELNEKRFGTDHPETATGLDNLGMLCDAQGRYPEAERLYKRSLKIREELLGPEHLDVAKSLNNLAALYDIQGKRSEAEPLYERSLRIREKALGPEHPIVALSLNNLAKLYSNQGRYSEAEYAYKRSLRIKEKTLGPEDPSTARGLNNLAELYRAQGLYSEAEPLYQHSLKLREKVLGPEHPDVAESLTGIALLYKRQERFDAAEVLSRRALAIAEKSLGACHPDTVKTMELHAAILKALGRNEDALALLMRLKENQEGKCRSASE